MASNYIANCDTAYFHPCSYWLHELNLNNYLINFHKWTIMNFAKLMFTSNSLFQRLLLRNLNKRWNLSRSIDLKEGSYFFKPFFIFIFFLSCPPSKSDLHLKVVGMNTKVVECLLRLCHQWRRFRPKYHLGRYARWTGLTRTLTKWVANVGSEDFTGLFYIRSWKYSILKIYTLVTHCTIMTLVCPCDVKKPTKTYFLMLYNVDWPYLAWIKNVNYDCST